jgi:ParB family chromosome partitioning protein
VSERLANDPERSTARLALVRTLGDLGDPAGARALLDLVASTEPDDEALRRPALAALLAIARDPARPDRRLASGATLPRYDEAAATGSLDAAARSVDVGVRLDAARALAAIEAPEGERILGALVLDREADVRFAAAEALAARVESFAAASLEPLAALLRAGRRELVLPAAEGLAARRRPEAFQALLLVFKAGEPSEQARAALALGTLGDRRVIEHLTPFVDPKSDVEDRTLAPDVAEALARMLGRLEGEDQATVRAIVHRLATEGDPSLRARAIAGLARAGDDVSRALVERVASEPLEPTRVRVEATRALARFGRVESEEVLAALLHDADATVRAAAKATLHALFPAEPTRVELHALASPHAELRQPAASFLSTRGDAAVLVARLAALDDAEVRRRLRHGLARRKAAPRAEIERLLEHAQPGPREDAALLAGAAASPELRAALEAALAGAARAFAEHRARAVGPARAREGAVVSSAWASTLWAARRVGADVGAGARAAAATTTAPGEVRRAALRALGGAATDGDRGLVASALADGEASTRRAGAALLPGLGAAAVEVVRAADSVDPGALAPWVRALPAADLARLTADAPTFPPLAGAVLAGGRVDAAIAIARDVTRALPARLVAIATLGLFGGAEAKATLEALYASGETAELKRAAFRALRRLLRGEAKRWADGEDRERRGAGGRFGGGEEEDAGDDDLGDDEESGDEDLDDDGDSDDDDNGDLGEDDDGDSGDDDDDGEFDDDDDDDDDDGEDDDDE